MIDLVVALGNPGKAYEKTRHNLGWMVLDAWLGQQPPAWKERFQGETAEVHVNGRKLTLLRPHTFMNRSGESVGRLAAYLNIPAERILVLHDDLELDLGRGGVRQGGGTGGHKGLRSLSQSLGADFWRMRLGVSRPRFGSVEQWVLSAFSRQEASLLESVLIEAARCLDASLPEPGACTWSVL